MVTFESDIAVLAMGKDTEKITRKLQKANNHIVELIKKWKIELNKTKSIYIIFGNKKSDPR